MDGRLIAVHNDKELEPNENIQKLIDRDITIIGIKYSDVKDDKQPTTNPN